MTARLIAALIFCIGLAGLIGDFFEVSKPTLFFIHLLFGVVLSLAVTSRLVQQRRVLGYHGSAEFYAYTRCLTRWVYILLYSLAGVRLSLYLFEIVVANFDPHVPDSVSRVRSLDDFQIYIAYGVIPLWVIRLFFWSRR